MFSALAKAGSPLLERARRHWAWIAVVLVVLLVAGIRVRLRDMPLERDEGEYAYAGQLLLQGIPPYKLAYNMKLPGTYVAYGLLMAVFGQSSTGVHLGLTVVNAASIVLVFLCGRRLLDDWAGVASALTYAFLSLSPAVLGLQAHATHFVVLPVLGGLFVLWRAATSGQLRALFLSGLLFGIGFLMKQHGVFFGIFGLGYLAWARMAAQREEHAWSKIRTRSIRFNRVQYIRELAAFAVGLAVPYALTCLWLLWAGVFPQFIFWTINYASEYISAVPLGNRAMLFRHALNAVISPGILLWLLSGVGAALMWSDRRLRGQKMFLAGLFCCSFLSISIGFYFRQHYFILLLPVLSLFAGVAVSRAIYALNRTRPLERLVSVPALGLFGLGLASMLVLHGETWFGQPPVDVVRRIYGTTLFPEAVQVGHYLRTNAGPNASIAVLGSEPEIYFYARRRSATGYIYMYPLMELHDYAPRMQQEMIREIEAAKPEYVVFVDSEDSWLRQEASTPDLHQWWPDYWSANYDLFRTIPIQWDKPPEDPEMPAKAGDILLFKRKTSGGE